MNLDTALKEAMALDGALGVSLVDYESGMCLGYLGGGKYLDLEVASAGNTEVVRAKMRTMEALGLDDTIEDILITLGNQLHIIRIVQAKRSGLFLYLALDKKKGNLGLARYELRRIEADLEI
jgi:predicted regulator of Ras-like GTPase activity (Roadblock/LC7/MglB family)